MDHRGGEHDSNLAYLPVYTCTNRYALSYLSDTPAALVPPTFQVQGSLYTQGACGSRVTLNHGYLFGTSLYLSYILLPGSWLTRELGHLAPPGSRVISIRRHLLVPPRSRETFKLKPFLERWQKPREPSPLSAHAGTYTHVDTLHAHTDTNRQTDRQTNKQTSKQTYTDKPRFSAEHQHINIYV